MSGERDQNRPLDTLETVPPCHAPRKVPTALFAALAGHDQSAGTFAPVYMPMAWKAGPLEQKRGPGLSHGPSKRQSSWNDSIIFQLDCKVFPLVINYRTCVPITLNGFNSLCAST